MKYGAIVIDPPVEYRVYNPHTPGRSAINHYGLMKWHELATLGPAINAVAAKDACLFLWVTTPLIPQTLELATEGWGWSFKTVAYTWLKLNRERTAPFFGLGYWTRANVELVFLMTRGHPKRRNKDVPQVIETIETEVIGAPVGRHSTKPEEVQNRIERLVNGPYLELFARRRRSGWTCLGNELDGLDIRESLRRVADDQPLPVLDFGRDLFDEVPA